jgi:hypothetical protein
MNNNVIINCAAAQILNDIDRRVRLFCLEAFQQFASFIRARAALDNNDYQRFQLPRQRTPF